MTNDPNVALNFSLERESFSLRPDDSRLAELFGREVLGFLVQGELLSLTSGNAPIDHSPRCGGEAGIGEVWKSRERMNVPL
jgi:hypothetical protein